MDMQSIGAAITGLRTATDIVKTILDINKNIEINAKVIDLQTVILGLQSSLLGIQNDFAGVLAQRDDLKKTLQQEDQWKDVEARYKLHEVDDDLFVYVSIDAKNPGIAPHWLCPNCFTKRVKSIIQMYNQNDMGRYYHCPECKTRYTTRT